ncbi:MAG: sigma-54-dependent Fis family transcriptional regulator [Candidatus Marinimicrobia bacterium]|nr:sigma-54-dependent Fis family transcriptional regulator [Candidatus Neomarinimicrobiota bacterium]
MASIFVIDDDKAIRDLLQESLESDNHSITTLPSAELAVRAMKTEEPDIILLDINLPGMSGFEFLKIVKTEYAHIPIVMITSNTDIDSAIKAMKMGASDYIQKPFNVDELSLIIDKILDLRYKDDHIAYLQNEEKQFHGFGEIIGNSSSIKAVFNTIQQLACSARTTVLIRGETGTGKELVARAIHANSKRSDKPFVEINCSALHEHLLEAELFGYEAGAFTGATHRKRGLLELAHKGTFFLDEIGDMELALQAKILKVIEKKTFRRVGGIKEIEVDTRIISATSRNLEEKIAQGDFRKDLFYRLEVATIDIPPLRERIEDVLLIADHFLKIYNKEFKKNIKSLSEDVKTLLLKHNWPGNVRELKNVIERAVLFEKSNQLTTKSVSIPARNAINCLDLLNNADNIQIPVDGFSLQELEKVLIQKALLQTRGNKTEAAKILNISRDTLKYRLKKYEIPRSLKETHISVN